MRLYKTRSIAAEACDKERVKVNNVPAKPSRIIKTGDEIEIHAGPYRKKVRVLQPAERRMAASAVADFYKDITSTEEIEKLNAYKAAMSAYGIRGSGRPTKKDRRDLEDFYDWRED